MMHRTQNAGFSLLELTMALVIIAVGLLSFAASLIAARDLRIVTHEETQAMNAARYVAEEIRALDTDYITTNLGGFCFDVPELEAPWPGRPFPGGRGGSSYLSSISLPIYEKYGDPAGGSFFTSPSIVDPYMDPYLDEVGMGFAPSLSPNPTSGYGCIVVDTAPPNDPNFVEVTINVEWGSQKGSNRRFTLTTYQINSDSSVRTADDPRQ